MRRATIFLYTLLMSLAVAARVVPAGEAMLDGDLVFVVVPQPDAITAVTAVAGEPAVNHVAIFHPIGGIAFVIEAMPRRGVCLTPLDSVATRGELLVARVDVADVPRTVAGALALVGRPYDNFYDTGLDAVYCSELVQATMVDAAGEPVFTTIPMTFRDASGEIPPAWVEHYRAAGRTVPEGAPGTNPAALLRAAIQR